MADIYAILGTAHFVKLLVRCAEDGMTVTEDQIRYFERLVSVTTEQLER